MQKILSLIDRLLHFLLITTVLLLIIPVSLQIFSRFTELIPRYMWTEEMSRFFFVWLIMLGATLGVRERLHFDVDFLPKLSPRLLFCFLGRFHGWVCWLIWWPFHGSLGWSPHLLFWVYWPHRFGLWLLGPFSPSWPC